MNRLTLTTAIVFAALLSGIPAYALTTEQGNTTLGDHANVADPDEQAPGYLKTPDEQRSMAPSDQFSVGGAPGMPTFRGNMTVNQPPRPHPVFSDQFNSDR